MGEADHRLDPARVSGRSDLRLHSTMARSDTSAGNVHVHHGTWHLHRAGLQAVLRPRGAQLTLIICAPALNLTATLDDASVATAIQGHGRDACWKGNRGGGSVGIFRTPLG